MGQNHKSNAKRASRRTSSLAERKIKTQKKLNIGLIASANACARGSIIIGPATQHYLSILLEGSGEREDSTKDGLRLLSLSLINKFN